MKDIRLQKNWWMFHLTSKKGMIFEQLVYIVLQDFCAWIHTYVSVRSLAVRRNPLNNEQPIIVSSATHRSALNAAILEADGTAILRYHRWQIPLEPAFASRTHKMQGATAKFGGVVSEPSAK